MGQQATDLGRARDAVRREAWEEAYTLLHRIDEADVKRRHDPDNLFQLNHNIAP